MLQHAKEGANRLKWQESNLIVEDDVAHPIPRSHSERPSHGFGERGLSL